MRIPGGVAWAPSGAALRNCAPGETNPGSAVCALVCELGASPRAGAGSGVRTRAPLSVSARSRRVARLGLTRLGCSNRGPSISS